jgi:hypothetical protein
VELERGLWIIVGASIAAYVLIGLVQFRFEIVYVYILDVLRALPRLSFSQPGLLITALVPFSVGLVAGLIGPGAGMVIGLASCALASLLRVWPAMALPTLLPDELVPRLRQVRVVLLGYVLIYAALGGVGGSLGAMLRTGLTDWFSQGLFTNLVSSGILVAVGALLAQFRTQWPRPERLTVSTASQVAPARAPRVSVRARRQPIQESARHPK